MHIHVQVCAPCVYIHVHTCMCYSGGSCLARGKHPIAIPQCSNRKETKRSVGVPQICQYSSIHYPPQQVECDLTRPESPKSCLFTFSLPSEYRLSNSSWARRFGFIGIFGWNSVCHTLSWEAPLQPLPPRPHSYGLWCGIWYRWCKAPHPLFTSIYYFQVKDTFVYKRTLTFRCLVMHCRVKYTRCISCSTRASSLL